MPRVPKQQQRAAAAAAAKDTKSQGNTSTKGSSIGGDGGASGGGDGASQQRVGALRSIRRSALVTRPTRRDLFVQAPVVAAGAHGSVHAVGRPPHSLDRPQRIWQPSSSALGPTSRRGKWLLKPTCRPRREIGEGGTCLVSGAGRIDGTLVLFRFLREKWTTFPAGDGEDFKLKVYLPHGIRFGDDGKSTDDFMHGGGAGFPNSVSSSSSGGGGGAAAAAAVQLPPPPPPPPPPPHHHRTVATLGSVAT